MCNFLRQVVFSHKIRVQYTTNGILISAIADGWSKSRSLVICLLPKLALRDDKFNILMGRLRIGGSWSWSLVIFLKQLQHAWLMALSLMLEEWILNVNSPSCFFVVSGRSPCSRLSRRAACIWNVFQTELLPYPLSWLPMSHLVSVWYAGIFLLGVGLN